MNEIVFAYDTESQKKVSRLSYIEIGLLVCAILALMLEVIWIFRPMIRSIIVSSKEIIEQNGLLTSLNEELSASEEELRQNVEELQSIQDNLQEKTNALSIALAENSAITQALDSSAIVLIADLNGNILKVNDIFCQVSGYTNTELSGQNFKILNSGLHSEDFWKGMWATVKNGNRWRSEVRNRAKDGSFYWTDTVINAVRDEENKIYKLMTISYLITDKKENEKQLRQLSLVASKTDNGVVIFDDKMKVIWLNEGFKVMTGYSLTELKGKQINILHKNETNEIQVDKIRQNLTKKISFTEEVLNYDKDNNSYWMEVNVTPIFNSNGEVEQFVGITRNITEQKKIDANHSRAKWRITTSIR